MARGPIPDKPRDRPTVPEVLEQAKAYGASLGEYHAWGHLHIALEDGNLEDDSILFCAERAVEDGDADGARIAEMLLAMTGTQRRKIYASL